MIIYNNLLYIIVFNVGTLVQPRGRSRATTINTVAWDNDSSADEEDDE